MVRDWGIESPSVSSLELDRAIARLAQRADAIFLREPAIDPTTPDTSDLDLLAFGGVDDLLPERIFGEGRPLDVIWLPRGSLDDPGVFARKGVLPHRLLHARPVHDPGGTYEGRAGLVERAMFSADVQWERIASLLDLGYLTVREIGVTWDFPPLALFWLHMAYASLLAALADAARLLCPNVYSRPFDYAPELESRTGLNLVEPARAALRLGGSVLSMVEPLRRIHREVASGCPEPSWPEAMRCSTRWEYRYFLSREELELRIAAASEMARRGNEPNGIFYLRLHAYSVARIPAVRRHALAGEDASFLRPRHSLRAELEETLPGIVPDLALVLASAPPPEAVAPALRTVLALRSDVVAFIERNGIPLSGAREWAPHRHPSSTSREEGSFHVQD